MPRFERIPISYPMANLLDSMPRKCSSCHRKISARDGYVDISRGYYLCRDCMIDHLQHKRALFSINPEFQSEGFESYGDIKLYYKNGGANLQINFPSLREARDAISKIRDMLGRYLLCECCGGKVSKLETHHWWEPPEYKYHQQLVCATCNGTHLNTKIWGHHSDIKNNEWPPSHIMPRWELQVLYRKGEFDLLSRKLKEEYIFPFPKQKPSLPTMRYLDLEREVQQKILQYEADIYNIAGHSFNIDSDEELSVVLYEELKLQIPEGVNKDMCAKSDVLWEMLGAHPVIDMILSYRERNQQLSNM